MTAATDHGSPAAEFRVVARGNIMGKTVVVVRTQESPPCAPLIF
jgi:hypothetical protein